MAVSKRLRYEILRRDNHACRYCGATAPDGSLVADVQQYQLRWMAEQELMQTILDGWRDLGTVADAWCEAWRDASADGIEPTATPQEFKDSLHRGVEAGLSIEALRNAARRAGSRLDPDLMAHLSHGGAA